MNESYKHDYFRMIGERWKLSPGCIVKFALFHHLRFMYCYRRYQQTGSKLARVMLFYYSRKYGLEISPRAKIGDGLYLGHPYNITVAEEVIIGKNVNLHKGCTIGRENRGKRAGVPTLGSCISVGINATIVGKVTIGDDVMVAPNSYVNFDVPAHSVVIGNPGIIHKNDDATRHYVEYRI